MSTTVELGRVKEELAQLRAAVDALAVTLFQEAYEMSIVGGESPRPMDYSEGHYVGMLKTLRIASNRVRELLDAS